MKAVLFLNPRSGRNRYFWPKLWALAVQAGIKTILVDHPPALGRIFLEEAHLGYGPFLVSGGDGTAAAAVTAYLGLKKRPGLAILAGGTMNLVAKDLGMSPQEEVIKALFRARIPKTEKRTIMRLSPPGICGLLIGGGLLVDQVANFQKRRNKGGTIPWKEFFEGAYRGLWRQETQTMVLALERGGLIFKGPFFFLLLSTLSRLFGWPLSFCLPEEIRGFSVPRGVPRSQLFASLWRLRKGNASKGPFVFCSHKLVVHTQRLALDGEVYVSPSRRFVIETAGEIEFLVW